MYAPACAKVPPFPFRAFNDSPVRWAGSDNETTYKGRFIILSIVISLVENEPCLTRDVGEQAFRELVGPIGATMSHQ